MRDLLNDACGSVRAKIVSIYAVLLVFNRGGLAVGFHCFSSLSGAPRDFLSRL